MVADSHLSPLAPTCAANWDAVRQYVSRSRSDLTVHLGDITLDAASDHSQLDSARIMCNSWPTSFRFLPGNHDIGDNPPGPENPTRQPFDPELLERFRIRFGPDYWSIAVDGWFVIGINAQLFGSGLPVETDQLHWLSEQVLQAETRPVVLMLHKPLFQNNEKDRTPHIRYVPFGPRCQLMNTIASLDLRMVLSGHVHQYLDRTINGIRHIWLPSTAFFLPDSMQERVGEKIMGVGVLELSRGNCRFDLVCPDGLSRNNLVEQPFYDILK
jgi:3',5'-cyclic AMP phosphodiesterase CpdA